MKTLGLIGGTSWHSTIEYYKYINRMVEERNSKPPKNPPLLLYSLNVDLIRRGDWDEINQAYLEISLLLQKAGAKAIMICANTPHKVCPFIEPHLDIPIIHIADAIGDEAQKKGLKTLGMFGTTNVMEEDFIHDILRSKYEINTLTAHEEARKEIHRIIAEELTRGKFKPKAKDFILQQMSELSERGADGHILGCTELPLLIKDTDNEMPLLNTTLVHSRKAVDFIFS